MAIVLCKFDGCKGKRGTRGYCNPHYRQDLRGETLTQLKARPTLYERLDNRTNKNAPKGCWVWLGAIVKGGYGHMYVEGRVQYVHRLSYERHKGPTPEGWQVDHRCHVRHCLNPEHLRAVTPGENLQNRGVLASDNTTGYTGVSYYKAQEMYSAEITLKGKSYRLGYFPTAEAAWEARKSKELELFTHSPLHGSMVG